MSFSDRAFHALAQREPSVVVAALRVLVPKLVAETASVRPEDLAPTRLDALAPPMDADWIARVGERVVVHLECQGYRDGGFLDRVFRYHLLLTLRHPERRVHTVALWLTPPMPAQRRGAITRNHVRVQVTQVVLGEVDAELLLRDPTTACFAPGADAGEMCDDVLCARAAAALATVGASWYQRHMAVITALSKGRYEAMKRAMSAAGLEPVIIEDLVYYGEDLGIAKGKVVGKVEGKAESIVRVAARRGLAFSEAQRAQVLACTDIPTLDAWLDRAVTAASADEVFRDGP